MRRVLKQLASGVLASAALLGVAFWWFVIPAWVDEPTLAGELRQQTLEWRGRTRHYLAYVPSRIAAAPKLVFVLHGSGGTGRQMRAVTAYGFDVLAERDGDIVVYPDGFEKHWNDCRRAGPYAANRENVDDVGFLKAIASSMAADLNVTWGGIFASGLSNGGHMALRLALEAPEWVAAVAPIAANMPVEENFDCNRSGKATGFLLINGTDDPMNPYDGGEVAMFGVIASRGHVYSSDKTVAYFAGLAGHQGAGTFKLYDSDATDGTTVEMRTWKADGRPPVASMKIVGGGHTVPHPRNRLPRILGLTSHDIDGTEMIWRFFANRES
jgi:polyhydroxybutyrate depolymerase